MTEEIPKQIQEEFTITSENMKYPTYPDEEYQKSISEDENLNNYSSQNIQKTFVKTTFLWIFNHIFCSSNQML
jgi:hypothetical protein